MMNRTGMKIENLWRNRWRHAYDVNGLLLLGSDEPKDEILYYISVWPLHLN